MHLVMSSIHFYEACLVSWEEKELLLSQHKLAGVDLVGNAVFDWACPSYGKKMATSALPVAIARNKTVVFITSPILFTGVSKQHHTPL